MFFEYILSYNDSKIAITLKLWNRYQKLSRITRVQANVFVNYGSGSICWSQLSA